MQENQLFEYAIIRVVPHVEREEFLNVGVIVFCAPKKYLNVKYHVSEERISALCNSLGMDELNAYIKSFERICKGGDEGGPIGKLSMAERFRWLTATRSTILQTSKVHPGLCHDPEQVLLRLFQQLVL
jgi:Protein of unknown function (DUF3037)